MDFIELNNMAFYGFHGNLASEGEQGQRFFVDLLVGANLSQAGQSDVLEDSINYVALYGLVETIMTGSRCHLLEHLGASIADAIMRDFPRVQGVRVKIRKPSVPIQGILDYAAVTTCRGADL